MRVLRISLRSRVLVGDGSGARWADIVALTAAQDGTCEVVTVRTFSSMSIPTSASSTPLTVVGASRPGVWGSVTRKMPSRLSSVSSPCWSRLAKSHKLTLKPVKAICASPLISWETYSSLELSYHCELEGVMIRLHLLYMITGDPHAPLRDTRAVYTPRGDTHAPDKKPP
jgi:hypothetical protein